MSGGSGSRSESGLLSNPARLFRFLALAEVVTWTLLLAGMLGKYVLHVGDLGVRIGGGVHGFAFLAYVLVTMLVSVDQRWRVGQLAVGLGSAVLPYATIAFERHAEHAGLLGARWRLRSHPASGTSERCVAWVLRRPEMAGLVGFGIVALVFSGLVRLGPPTQWFTSGS